jgi:threonine dehydratase
VKSEVQTIVSLEEIQQAYARVHEVALRTPLVLYPEPRENHRRIYLKLESLQPIGSFKLRGAYNKIAGLSEAERVRGVISYSSGNHAQGVAYAARAVGARATIVMPSNAPKVKVESTAALGADIVLVGPASLERQARAEELAAEHGYCIIPPFDDERIIAGTGSIGLEILEDLPEVETVLAPIGGGGLISGVAAAIKQSHSHARVIGVEPEVANDAQRSLRAGHRITISVEQTTATIADGLRTQTIGVHNFEHISRFVDDIITVTDDEIRAAMRRLAHGAHIIAEPSGAVTFAALMFHADELPKSRYNVAIISGGNVDPKLLNEVLA